MLTSVHVCISGAHQVLHPQVATDMMLDYFLSLVPTVLTLIIKMCLPTGGDKHAAGPLPVLGMLLVAAQRGWGGTVSRCGFTFLKGAPSNASDHRLWARGCKVACQVARPTDFPTGRSVASLHSCKQCGGPQTKASHKAS